MDYQMECSHPLGDQPPPSFTPGTSRGSLASVGSVANRESNQIPQVYIAIGKIHEICLRATSTYLGALDANRRARESCSPISQTPNTLRDDKKSNHTNPLGHPHQGNSNSRVPQPSSSLLKNVSTICTQLWMGSQRDRLDVLNVEREAAKTMALLLEWAETVVLGDYDEWALAGEDAFWKVVRAGRHLCEWLGVQESIDAMNELQTQLADEGGTRIGSEERVSP
ncbi:hypothetical protein PG993_001930 [Apiospora rasikravindrae]|uniref:Uncharacterized protein n=1 Tax=Apiospora rasikravindrae TaxID=990691 RepID=A0ABR1UFL2_9PEZI